MRCCTPMSLEHETLNAQATSYKQSGGVNHKVPSLHCSYAVLFTSLFPEFLSGYLSASDVLNVGMVSKAFYRAVQQPQVWRTLLQCHFRFSDADIKALDRLTAGPLASGGSPSTPSSSLYVRAQQASSFVLRPGCTIDPLMLAADFPRLARVLHGQPVSCACSTGRKSLPSPDRCTSTLAGYLTSSQGVTPTPSRHRPWSTTMSSQQVGLGGGRPNRLELVTPTSVQEEDDDNDFGEFHLRASIHDLVANAGQRGVGHVPILPSIRAPLESMQLPEDDAWSGRWHNELPSQHANEYLFHVEQGTHATLSSFEGIVLEPLVQSTHFGDDDDDGTYASGALVLGSECHNRFSEIWESQEASRQPTSATTVLHLPLEPFEYSEPLHDDGVRSSSLMSHWFGSGVDNTTPVPRVLATWHHDDDGEPHQQEEWAAAAVCTKRDSECCSTNTVVLASVVCAETLVSSLRCGADVYPFQKLFAYVHRHRVRTFLDDSASSRSEALEAFQSDRCEEALELINKSVERMMEGGCGSTTATNLRDALVRDLLLRGRILRALQRDDEALGDFALAYVLDESCQEAYAESSVILTGAERCATHAANILSSSFLVDAAYDELVVAGKSITDCAAFLFEVLFWRGPSPMLYMYQYLICDTIGYRPSRLLLNAERLAESPSERLTIRAWILHDRGHLEPARSTAELAVSLMSHDVTRSVATTEQRCVEMTKCLMEIHNIEQFFTTHAPTTASHIVQKLVAIREAMQALNDVDLASVLAVVNVEEMRVFVQALYQCDVADGSRSREDIASEHCAALLTSSYATSAIASFSYFTLAFMNRDSDVAVDAYKRHLFSQSLPSRTATALQNLGYIILKRQGPAAALQLFETARVILPTHIQTLKNIARCHTQLGNTEDAYHALSAAANSTVFRGPRAEVLYERSCLTRSHIQDLNLATDLNPRFSHPYRLRAAMFMDRGDAHAAIEEMGKVISLTMSAEDVELRALFRRDAGDRSGAMRDMALAVTLVPTNKEYRNALRELVVFDALNTWNLSSTSSPTDGNSGDLDEELLHLRQLQSSTPSSTPVTQSPSDTQHDRLRNAVIDEETDRTVVDVLRLIYSSSHT